MTPSESTKPLFIDALNSITPTWQSFLSTWSFHPMSPARVPRPPRPELVPNPRASNVNGGPGHETRSAQEAQRIQPLERVPEARLGKRAFAPLSHWEGVVESVSEFGFRGRLLPFEQGRPLRGRVEFSDFAFADLAEESDRDLVAPGAVFYWTIGRSRQRSGTLQNASLVRFRRTPPPSQEQKRIARALAKEILGAAGESP
jgi:hypothetical protein